MKKLSLVLTLVFIIAYIVLLNLGAVLSEQLGVVYSGECLLFLLLSAVLLVYAGKKKLLGTLGLAKPNAAAGKASLYYIPLIIIIPANGLFFFDATKPPLDILMSVVFMALVAFLEELLFRGFLFKTMEERGSTSAAVIVAGLSFGFGHILNLFNGYSSIDQILQIVIASIIGIVLCILFIRTKSIVPGIIFHCLFNSASALSAEVQPLYNYIMAGIIIAVSAVYLVYLLKTAKRAKA